MAESIQRLARLVGGKVVGDETLLITGIAGLKEAKEGELTFLANPKYASKLSSTRASAVIAANPVEGKTTILTPNPYLAFARLLGFFSPSLPPQRGIHPFAVINSDARLGDSVSIYPYVYVGAGAKIGDRVVLFPGVFVGEGVEIGNDTIVYSNVSIREGCKLGQRVIVHCNAVIGSDGFGFAKDGAKHVKIPQVGSVRIEDDVEIGACVTIDRAVMGETVIGRGTKIDNLVQIAHNVEIGCDSIIVAQVGISGSTKIGSRVTLAGQAGVVGHIRIGDDCIVGAQSGVAKDLASGEVFSGSPCIPHKEWLKVQTVIPRLPEMRREILELKKEIAELKKIFTNGIDTGPKGD